MNYEEYVGIIEELKLKNDIELKNKLLESTMSSDLIPMLEPKVIDLIRGKFQILINKMISNLETMFMNNYELDQYLINFKKDVSFIYELTNVNVITEPRKQELKKMLQDETNRVYEILETKANQIDMTGVLSMTIKNTRIKWGE